MTWVPCGCSCPCPCPTVPIPRTIAGLLLWLRADLGVTPRGGPVAVWQDQSGANDPNRDFTQFIAVRQPALNVADAAYNNQDTISFVSANFQQLIMVGLWSVAPVTQPYTMIVVGNDGNLGSQVFFGDANANNWYVAAFAGFYGSSVIGNLFSTTPDSVVPKILYIEANDPNSTVRVSDETVEGVANVSFGNLPQMEVGAASGGAAPLNGKIAEVLVYQGLLSAADRVTIMNYLSSRYGIAVGP